MPSFVDARSAMDFLVSEIAAEAELEAVALSAIERNMLYFSENAPTLPDIMEVNDTFDRDYDQTEYEKKISGLISKRQQRFRVSDKEALETWNNAVRAIGKLDYYLLVMIAQATSSFRPRGDLLKLIATGVLIVAAIFGLAMFANR
jgi:hypothetical protein